MSDNSIYSCPACGHQESEYFPRCPACNKWLDPSEIRVEESELTMHRIAPITPALSVTNAEVKDPPRISTGFPEVDRVLGGPREVGGICEGSAIIFSGAPGVGKSTLLMQIASRIAEKHGPVLYVSAEESLPQAAARSKRIGARDPKLFILPDRGFEEAVHEMYALKAVIVVIDSLQLMRTKSCNTEPGSPGQVKEVSAKIVELAKKSGTPFLVAGQIVKTGEFAGPMSVPHLYDAVFHLDEMTLPGFVLLRVEKNRFGSKEEVGSFRMTAHGIEEVISPGAELLKGGGKGIIAVAMEGTKPIATEIQIGFLQRGDLSKTVVGYPPERLRLIQTILDQYGIEVPNTIALDVLGGYTISDSAADLAVAIAAAHAVKTTLMPASWGAIGEVALDGRLLPPHDFVSRHRELDVLGIQNVIVPHIGSDTLPPSTKIKTIRARTLLEALRAIGLSIEFDEAGRPKETRQAKAASAKGKAEALKNDRARKKRIKKYIAELDRKHRKKKTKPKNVSTKQNPESAPALTTESSKQPPPATLPPTHSLKRAPIDPMILRIAKLVQIHHEHGITPDLIRRNLNVSIKKAYQLHEAWNARVAMHIASRNKNLQ